MRKYYALLIIVVSATFYLVLCIVFEEHVKSVCGQCERIQERIDSLEIENARLVNDIEIYKHRLEEYE